MCVFALSYCNPAAVLAFIAAIVVINVALKPPPSHFFSTCFHLSIHAYMHASRDSGHLPQFTAFGHIFNAILQVMAAIEQGANDGRWAKSALEPRMWQKLYYYLFGRQSSTTCV